MPSCENVSVGIEDEEDEARDDEDESDDAPLGKAAVASSTSFDC